MLRRISLEHARAVWLRAQSLTSPSGVAADTLRRTGWLHAAGGSTVALSMVARGVSVADAVAAELDREDLIEVPGVRRSMFLVPREDAGVALAASIRSTRDLMSGAWQAAGCSQRDVTAMKRAVLAELEAHPLSVGALGKRVPPNSVRKTGSDGGALGLRSTVHLALRELQHEGKVLRIPEERRLDGDRYLWKRASIATVALNDQALDRELARRVISWAGPATLKEIAWWAGITQRAARAAVEGLECDTVEVDGWSTRAFVGPGRLDETVPQGDAVTLLPFRDNYVALRRGLAPLLSPEARGATLLDWRGKPAVAGALDALHHPAILVRGMIVGIWEYDPEASSIVWRLFDDASTPRRSLTRTARALERLIHDELGDARFYPFDSGPGRRARIADAKGNG